MKFRCHRCHRPIEWATIWRLDEDRPPRHRSRMPLDPPGATGAAASIAVYRTGGQTYARVLTSDRYTLPTEELRVTHFATCPVAARPLPDNVIPLRQQRLRGTGTVR